MVRTIKYNAIEDKTSELNKILDDIICPHCDSKFSCEANDLYCKSDNNNLKFLVVDCPVCGNEVTIEGNNKYIKLRTWPVKPSGSYWDR